jgi:hypothetical protein
MSAKHEKAIMIRQPKRTYTVEATALQVGMPALSRIRHAFSPLAPHVR